MFERAHCLMTFEDLLVAMYEEPEAVNELFSAYTDWKLKACEMIIDNLQPDIIHSHDDWGSKTNLFFSPQKFRELLKPHYARLYGYIKKRGVLVQHHADSYLQGIEKDMADLGIDMWQAYSPRTSCDQENTIGKMLLRGGLEQGVIDRRSDGRGVRAEVPGR
jgi:uroporphyrinogen-III decarboxylase